MPVRKSSQRSSHHADGVLTHPLTQNDDLLAGEIRVLGPVSAVEEWALEALPAGDVAVARDAERTYTTDEHACSVDSLFALGVARDYSPVRARRDPLGREHLRVEACA